MVLCVSARCIATGVLEKDFVNKLLFEGIIDQGTYGLRHLGARGRTWSRPIPRPQSLSNSHPGCCVVERPWLI